jgi:hypothetical protein
MRYNTVKMLPQQSLSDYTANFNRLCENMRTLKCSDNPSKKAMARHFLMTLDRSRFGEYMVHAFNLERTQGTELPGTIQAVADAARSFIPNPHHAVLRRGTPMVYQTTEDDSEQADVYSTLTEEQLKRPCANCKEFGHWARECPEPDHREEPADDKQTADSKREDKKQSGQTGGRRHGHKKPGKRSHSAVTSWKKNTTSSATGSLATAMVPWNTCHRQQSALTRWQTHPSCITNPY